MLGHLAAANLTPPLFKALGIALKSAFPHLRLKLTEAPNDRTSKAARVGLNHIAVEVGDIEEALAFYGRPF
jgi:hypothetical protein